MEATAMRPNATKLPANCSMPVSFLQPPSAAGVVFLVPKSVRLTSSFKTPMIARASDPKTDQVNPSTDEPGLPFLPQVTPTPLHYIYIYTLSLIYMNRSINFFSEVVC
uniref:Uncharacterized protein n=1 Tax=Solanum tuberosum TaxID=4113 RepID=M0ZIZ2_SOLTU